MIFLFGCLGIWQVQRYHFKNNLQILYQHNLHAKTLPLNRFNQLSVFQGVNVQGYYLPEKTVLIQNKFYHGQLGVEVLTPFKVVDNAKWLMIDRGWTKEPIDTIMNKVKALKNLQTLEGNVKLHEFQFILGKNILNPHTVPLLAQKIDFAELSEVLHQSFYPFIVKLKTPEPTGFIQEWTLPTLLPERHLGYAVQWFLLAFAIAVAYFCYCCNEEKTSSRQF